MVSNTKKKSKTYIREVKENDSDGLVSILKNLGRRSSYNHEKTKQKRANEEEGVNLDMILVTEKMIDIYGRMWVNQRVGCETDRGISNAKSFVFVLVRA